MQDAVDILDTLLDQRNDMSFQVIHTGLYILFVVCHCIFMYIDIFNDYTCLSTGFLAVYHVIFWQCLHTCLH